MRFDEGEPVAGPRSTGNSPRPFPIPRVARERRDVDPHEELLKLHGLGVASFGAVCLVREERVDGVFVAVPPLRKGEQGSSSRVAEAVAVMGDMARVLVEKAGGRLAGDTTGGDLLIEVLAVIGMRNGLPFLQGDMQVLTGPERAAAVQRFGLQ